jgi:hypothetical protein
LLFTFWRDWPYRPARDVDLLGFGLDDIDMAVATLRTVCQIAVDDGIAFDPATVKGSVVRKEAGYSRARIDIQARLEGVRIALKVGIASKARSRQSRKPPPTRWCWMIFRRHNCLLMHCVRLLAARCSWQS